MNNIIAENLSFSYDGTGRNLDRLNFRIESGGPLYVTMLRIYVYPPTGE